MAKKVHVDLDYSEDYQIIGISCHKLDYWIVGQINQNLKLNLTREADLPVYNTVKDAAIYYPFFHFIRKDDQVSFSIVSNHHPDGKLFPGQKSLDYFLLVKGRINDDLLKIWLTLLKKIPQVLTAQQLNISKIKNHQEFFSDLELHLIEIAAKKKNRKNQ
jgi:hypothetical protein